MSNYRGSLYGDCTTSDGWIRVNVGLQRCRIRDGSQYSGTCIIQHPLGNAKQCWISRLLDYRGQFVW